LGEFEADTSIYEEAMDSVTRVRDLSLIFDAYSRFEEGTITAHLALLESEETVNDDPVIEPDNHGDEDSQGLVNGCIERSCMSIIRVRLLRHWKKGANL